MIFCLELMSKPILGRNEVLTNYYLADCISHGLLHYRKPKTNGHLCIKWSHYD